MSNENHPVWDLYNEYRTARFNKLYFGKQLTFWKRINLFTEIFIAITTSIIAGLWIWTTLVGSVIWESIIVIAALFAIIKPFVNLSSRIQQQSEILNCWRTYEIDLYSLILQVKQNKSYNIEIQNRFISMMDIKKTIIHKEPLEDENKKLKNKCYYQVIEELPIDYFYIPEEEKMPDEKEPKKSQPEPSTPATKSAPDKFSEPETRTKIEPPKPWPRKSEK
jgi:ABC-type multidrug transport system fused ATPase/permease subunit